MAGNVTVFGDWADKYDALVAYDEKILDNYVEEQGYSLGSMVLASTAIAFMKFSTTFTDIGRLGNGILVEGGWKGVGKDALRALNLAGAAGAVAGRASQLLKVVQAGDVSTCSLVAQTNAIRLSGQRFAMTVEKLAEKSGISLETVAAQGRQAGDYAKMMTAMRQMGIPARELMQGTTGSARTFEAMLQALRGAGKGVVTFTVRGPGLAHRLYATIGRAGNLVIRDPQAPGILTSLTELRQAFPGTTLSSSEVIFVPSSMLVHASHLAQGLSEMVITARTLALAVKPVVYVRAGDSDTAIQALHVREAVAGKNLAGAPYSSVHVVQQNDWLSKLAQHYYGNMRKWPVIYEANRKTIGKDPNLIKPGQRLVIPPLPAVVSKYPRSARP